MTTKHTPESWEIADDFEAIGFDVIDPNDTNMGRPARIARFILEERHARLIAAAPDLLEALKTLWDATPASIIDDDCYGLADMVPAAIAKATEAS